MDLRQLAALVAVADTGSFSAAADQLHTVQSNVSTHVARLEKELGAQLVDRSAGRLTEEGEAVVARARRIQGELDAVVGDLSALRHEVSGNVRLGVISTTARWLIPLMLDALAARHPGVKTVVVDASTTSLAPQLVAGRLDLAVLNLPIGDPELTAEALFDEDFLLVTPVGHPLFDHESVDMKDLAEVELFLPPTGTALRNELDQAARQAGVELQAKAELDGVRLTASLVFQGHGAAVLPATAVSSWQEESWRRIALRSIPERRVGLAWRRRGRLSAPARALQQVIREVVAREAETQPGVRLAGIASTPG
jgi:LysR family hydrogen peroxide-inducible transcriptional activator